MPPWLMVVGTRLIDGGRERLSWLQKVAGFGDRDMGIFDKRGCFVAKVTKPYATLLADNAPACPKQVQMSLLPTTRICYRRPGLALWCKCNYWITCVQLLASTHHPGRHLYFCILQATAPSRLESRSRILFCATYFRLTCKGRFNFFLFVFLSKHCRLASEQKPTINRS